MAKLIKAYKDNFTIVDNDIFRDERLSYKDLGLLCQLLSLPDEWNFSVSGLVSLHRDGKASIITGLEKLEEFGYLTRKQSRGESGLYSGYNYFIYQNPLDNPDFDPKQVEPKEEEPDDKHPSTENRITDNRFTENRKTVERKTDSPSTDNPPQLNTKEIKKEKINISVTGETEQSYSKEEVDAWTVDEFYAHLTDTQYDAFIELFNKSISREIHSSKDSLIIFFKKMIVSGWKDAKGKPIKNIVGYVTAIFNAVTEEQRKDKDTEDKDIVPEYDDSSNPQFDEERFNEIMNKRSREEP